MCTKFLGDGLCCGYDCLLMAQEADMDSMVQELKDWADDPMACPQCGRQLLAVEYSVNDPDHYDGVSEWACFLCGYHRGRWSGKLLEEGETEPKYGRAR